MSKAQEQDQAIRQGCRYNRLALTAHMHGDPRLVDRNGDKVES